MAPYFLSIRPPLQTVGPPLQSIHVHTAGTFEMDFVRAKGASSRNNPERHEPVHTRGHCSGQCRWAGSHACTVRSQGLAPPVVIGPCLTARTRRTTINLLSTYESSPSDPSSATEGSTFQARARASQYLPSVLSRPPQGERREAPVNWRTSASVNSQLPAA